MNNYPAPLTSPGAGTVVAVIDSGIDPELVPRGTVVLPGVNLSGESEGTDTGDPAGHGSAVAATVARIAPGAKLLPVKTMNRRGVLRDEAAIDSAFAWIAARRAELGIGIVCAAFADSSHRVSDEKFRGTALQRHIAELRHAGVPTVAAAGNWYPEHRSRSPQGMAWPAVIREIVSVGALAGTQEGVRLAQASQRLHKSVQTGCGTTCFALPGDPGETSGAAAVIAGCLAALRSAQPEASVDVLIERLLGRRRIIADEAGLRWPVVDPDDLFAG